MKTTITKPLYKSHEAALHKTKNEKWLAEKRKQQKKAKMPALNNGKQ